ncbi:MAG: translation elongation factor Ts [Nitrospinae bacterium]|nr:translation elongation factor Ts [Nitrospinota bacterium]
MEITATMVKDLREKTGCGMMDCKKALNESNGDLEKAVDFLRKKGLADAQKKQARTANEGIIGTYIHAGGKIGVLVEVNCETDFVAKTDEFNDLAKDIAMHVAAQSPLYVKRDEVPDEALQREKEIFADQARQSGKPEKIIEKIVDGKIDKFYGDICLLEQAFVKDPSITINELISRKIASLGENISVRRFARFQVGK